MKHKKKFKKNGKNNSKKRNKKSLYHTKKYRKIGGNLNKKYFVTFSDGNQNYLDAGKRLVSQAEKTNLFNSCIHYKNIDLQNDTDFWNKHHKFIEDNRRGNGYWIWKPYIINKTMSKLDDGDILLYLDGGCEIDHKKKDKIKLYMEKTKTNLLIGTTTPHLEKCWCKKDLINLIQPEDNSLNTYQRQAGGIMILVNPITRKFVNEWESYTYNYHNLNDTPSKDKNDECFREHRHDQSIFSLLVKKYNLDNDISLHDVIEYQRNKSGKSRI